MKNNQLRNLNYVFIDGEIQTVAGFCRGYVLTVETFKDDKYGDWIDMDRLSFIPITEEWLIKLGFERSSIGLIKDIFLFMDNIICIPNGIDARELKHIKHVHQLQNIYFALTEEELTINI